MNELVEVWMREGLRFENLTFEPGAIAGRVPCHECGGTGWWGYGPIPEVNGPCIDCKGTGREWVGLT